MKNCKDPPVLFADDDENDTYFFRLACEAAAITNPLLTFFDGQGVIDFLTDQDNPRPGLLVLDLKMPRVDGFEMLRKMQEEHGRGSVPVIMFSGKVDEETASRAAREGAQAFIGKPFDPQALIESTKQLLSNR